MPNEPDQRPKFTFVVKGKHWYFRRAGGFRRSLPSEPGTEAFQTAYDQVLAEYARTAEEMAQRRAERRERARKSRLTRADADAKGTVYLIGGTVGPVKIGYTSSLAARFERLQMNSPVKLRILVAVPGSPRDELILHRRFEGCRLHGEWFKRTPELKACIARAAPLSGEEQRVSLLTPADTHR